MAEQYYAMGIREVLESLGVTEEGLTSAEAKQRLEQYGPNALQRPPRVTPLKIFFGQFANALVVLLIGAGLLSIFLGERVESIAIFCIILINAILGFVQEYKAEKAVEALEKIAAPTAKVLRDGRPVHVPAAAVVPGDILLLEEGDIIAADGRVLEVASLQTQEASLTGESLPLKKITAKLKAGTTISDQVNMVFLGTVVSYGKGRAVVTGSGMQTELGKIAKSIHETKETKTPLQIKFGELAKQIGAVAIILIGIVLIAGTIQGELSFTKMLLFSLVLAVATIPSALPVIVTVSLSLGAKRLVQEHMLIKKLPAAESLGAVTVICSDKTGTITKNEMTVTAMLFNGRELRVTGAGYLPEGDFFDGEKPVRAESLELPLRIGTLCSNAKLLERQGKWEIAGDPTEGALLVLASKGQLTEQQLKVHFTERAELPFDSDRKRMTKVFFSKTTGKLEAYVKGAPDLLLDACDRIWEKDKVRKLTAADRREILQRNDAFASRALRVLGLAYREVPEEREYRTQDVERNLIFVGLVGMIDPPREEVRDAVQQCQQAGIRAMVITGDHALTTRAVAKQIGLMGEHDLILTGAEVDQLDDVELEAKIEKIRIIARALPIQKERIVVALQKLGHVVAMTGDGVNDAPALKKADIGVAMGITGTDVSKEVAKAILVDDNFASIVGAVREGRNIYDKMIKSAKYLLSCNSGEIATVLFAILLGMPLPLLPLQVLLINLLTDTFPAVGLGFESSESGIMQRAPRDPKGKPISKPMFVSIILLGVIMGIGTLFVFKLYDANLPKAQTMAFTTLVMFQMWAVLSSRSLQPSLEKLNPFSNLWLLGGIALAVLIQVLVIYWPPLQFVFGTVAIGAMDWVKLLVVSSLGFIVMELSKFALSFGEKSPA